MGWIGKLQPLCGSYPVVDQICTLSLSGAWSFRFRRGRYSMPSWRLSAFTWIIMWFSSSFNRLSHLRWEIVITCWITLQFWINLQYWITLRHTWSSCWFVQEPGGIVPYRIGLLACNNQASPPSNGPREQEFSEIVHRPQWER